MKAKSSDRGCTQELFKIVGRSPSNRRVRMNSVVERFNISKDVVLCLLPGAVVVQMNQLAFQASEEILRDSVVIWDRPFGTCFAGFSAVLNRSGKQ